MYDLSDYQIAAIVPCHNEEAAVAKVVRNLRAAVPSMDIYVFDNCSTDRTAERAVAAGATVRSETRKGKGNVIRRAFADIDADIYLLIDGDDTYDAAAAPLLIQRLLEGPYDHVLGVRELSDVAVNAYRPAHEFGNRFLNGVVGTIFGANVGDMLSGYRVFSRRFVKSFPAVSREFEIETELTVHCLALRIPSASVGVGFKDRAEGSESKLRTYRDGTKILSLIMSLARHERPGSFYGLLGLLTALLGLVLTIPIVVEFVQTGLVSRQPTLLLAITMVGASCIAVIAGLILDGIRKSRHELSRLVYLGYPAASAPISVLAVSAERLPRQRNLTVDHGPSLAPAHLDSRVS